MKRKVCALEKVDADLPNLQHKIRRDPQSYKEDFYAQYVQYENQKDIFLQAPSTTRFGSLLYLPDLIDFISHVADCYRDITVQFPEQLIYMLKTHHQSLDFELREKIVSSLMLLRRKNLIDSTVLLNTLFPILTTTDSKSLRQLLFQKIVSDLRTSNAKTKNHKLNQTMQTVLFNIITEDQTSVRGLWGVKLTREMWRRQIWTDSKTVEIMRVACLADNEKVIIGGVRFFLGGDKEREEAEEESEADDNAIDIMQLRHQHGINKKTKKKAKALEKAVAVVKKKERGKQKSQTFNFPALHLLHDPQGFAEALFSKHLQGQKTKLNLEQKLLVLQLVSRLVGFHRLSIMSLYSYFLKYLTPRQPSVTSFLASLAQATHPLVPPDLLEPLVQKIANEFVSEAAAAEVASAGLNAIREICVRQPLAMNDTLLQDLVMYRKSKDKGVMMAAKGLLSLYREVGADMLKRKDRGKDASIGLRTGERKAVKFGEERPGEIEGIELLEKWKEEQRRQKRLAKGLPEDGSGNGEGEDENDDDSEDWANWEVEEDDSDDSGGWINVQSDEEIVISDSEDDENDDRPSKKSKTEENEDKEEETEKKVSTLATTKILTPADLLKLQELRSNAEVNKLLPSSKKRQLALQKMQERHMDDPLTAAEIEGLAALSTKSTKEARLEAMRQGKSDRSEHKSTTAIRQEKKRSEGKSTTNKEKARRKNFLMTLGKAKGKQKRSLAQQSKILKAHVQKSKRGGRRGNGQ